MSLLQQRVSSVSYLGISLSVCLSVYLSIYRSISVEQPPTPLFYDTSKPLTADSQSVNHHRNYQANWEPIYSLYLSSDFCSSGGAAPFAPWFSGSNTPVTSTHNVINTAHIVNLSQHSKKVQIVRDLSLQLTMFGYTKCYHTSSKYASCVVFWLRVQPQFTVYDWLLCELCLSCSNLILFSRLFQLSHVTNVMTI